jgi:LPXTG-site transpeptidase (sortase) family protein
VRKSAGTALVIVGSLLLAFAFGRYADGAVRSDEARRAWESAEARMAIDAAIRGGHQVSYAEAPIGAPIARLVIPSAGLDEIVLEGMGDLELNAGPGHLPGSAYPGAPGNSIISAHRDRHFKSLGSVSVGDTIITESGYDRTLWIVVARRIVHKDAPALFHSDEPRLTLTTCWPVRYFGPAPERLIVTAEPLEQPKRERRVSASQSTT